MKMRLAHAPLLANPRNRAARGGGKPPLPPRAGKGHPRWRSGEVVDHSPVSGGKGGLPPPRVARSEGSQARAHAPIASSFTGRRSARAPHVIAPAAGVEGRSPPPRSG